MCPHLRRLHLRMNATLTLSVTLGVVIALILDQTDQAFIKVTLPSVEISILK